MPPCDIKTLLEIEAYAPHLLTPHDRHCLRVHRAAPVVRRVTCWVPLACLFALAALPFIFFGWGR